MEAKLLHHSRPQIIENFVAQQEKGRDYLPKGIELMGARRLWRQEGQGEGTVIAVLDTGCDVNHPDLKENIIGGRNFTTDYNGDVNNYNDNQYHGTHVAGTIAARFDGSGVIGVAPKAKLLICKVLRGEGGGAYSWIAEAIRWCINWRGPKGERVNIINCSLGGPSYNTNLHNAVKEAVAANIAVIVAAGNEGDGNGDTEEISYPAYFPEVIAVGAVDFHRNVANFSNTNKEIDVASVGVDVLSTYSGGRYGILNGTSMACPHVAGFSALLRGKHFRRFGRYPTEPELYHLLKFHTIDINESGVDARTGAGFVTVFPDHNSSLILK